MTPNRWSLQGATCLLFLHFDEYSSSLKNPIKAKAISWKQRVCTGQASKIKENIVVYNYSEEKEFSMGIPRTNSGASWDMVTTRLECAKLAT